jgi:hypothetical protein
MPDGPDQTTQAADTPQAPPTNGYGVGTGANTGGGSDPVATSGGGGGYQQPQQQQQQQPPAGNGGPTPQQQDFLHHALIGKAVQRMLGNNVSYSVDANGNTVAKSAPSTPGQWARSMVMGAMLGLAAGPGNQEGGSQAGFLSGLGRGAAAVAQNQQQQDDKARAQAQEQFKNQLEAKKDQREADAAKTEEQVRQATIAHENAETLRTQIAINTSNEEQKYKGFQQEAENGNAKLSVYKAAGIPAMADNITQQEQAEILKNNPKASTWDWEQTGVKTILTTDKNGNTVSSYEPIYSAYDPKTTVPVTKEFLDLLKKSKIDSYFPGTTSQLKEGQQLTPTQFVTLKGQYEKANQQRLSTEKEEATIAHDRALALSEMATAEKKRKDDKAAAQLGDGLDAWSKQYQELLKTNPNATDVDAFNKLPPGQRLVISNSLLKRFDSDEKVIKDSLTEKEKSTDPVEQKQLQDQADQAKADQENIRRYMNTASSATAPVVVKPAKPGDPLTTDSANRYLQQAGGDKAKARQLAINDGWSIPAAAPGGQLSSVPSSQTLFQDPNGGFQRIPNDAAQQFQKNHPNYKNLGVGTEGDSETQFATR